MNFRSSSFATLAAVCYGVFAAFGFAVWHTLLITAVPKGTTALEMLQGLLMPEPGANFLRLHAITTLVTAALAVLLAMRPPVAGAAYMACATASVLLAVFIWAVFAPDAAILPSMAALALVWGWFKASRNVQ
ncbi:hypothetical protein, partial [Ideonella sp.]|uniref:hypothetical protein n=1 Tax=Ideonella sp. TaxID=1929293 RepID=UPI0035B33D8C